MLGDRASPIIDRLPSARGRTPSGPEQPDDFFRRDQRGDFVRQRRRLDAASRIAMLVEKTARCRRRCIQARGWRRSCHRHTPVESRLQLRAPALPGSQALGARTRLVEIPMPESQRHAECATGVAGRRLDPDFVEGPSRRMRRCRRSSARRRRRDTGPSARSHDGQSGPS
jgi:hypothetical protein